MTKIAHSFRLSESWIQHLALLFTTLALLATFIAGGSDLWSYAPRVYILPIAAVVGVAFLIKLDLLWAVFLRLRNLILIYLLFVIFQSVCYYLDGMALSQIIRRASSTHVLAFLGFLTVLPLASVAKYRNWIVTVVVVVIGFSLLIAIMQWVGFDLAWQVAATVSKKFIGLWGQSTPGFAMHSVSLGYQLLFISPVVIYFAILADRRYVALRWLCAVGLPLFLLPIQSRSVSITFTLVAAAILLLASRPASIFFVDRLRTLAFVFVGSMSILTTTTNLGAVVVFEAVTPYSFNQTIKCQALDASCDSELIENNSGSIRLIAMKAVIESIESPADFILGPSVENYRQKLPANFGSIYPHNLIFNALLLSGVIGVILVCSVYLLILGMALPFKSYLEDRILFLSGISLMAQVLNSMFHNDSLNHGSIYPWFIAALILGRVFERNVKSS